MNVEKLGQVFTQENVVNLMLRLRKNEGSILEPSCGSGAFSNKIENCVAVELDKTVSPPYAICKDFFQYEIENKFDSIIGNPPFVKYKNILGETIKNIKNQKFDDLFDERSNLYLFFIYKCILHLNNGGELIFINPREFLKATSSLKLNEFLFKQGTITDFIDLGDARIFGNFTPNCVIWRFEKGNVSRTTQYSIASIFENKLVLNNKEEKKFKCSNGQLNFTKNDYSIPFSDIFYVKVGGVSGADKIFAHPKGNKSVITSETFSTKKTKKFFYNKKAKELIPFKEELLKRKIKNFTEDNWYMWGRNIPSSKEKRLYVNCKTRKNNPFFLHNCNNYDGSILGIFPKNQETDLVSLVKDLNSVNWEDLGFVCGGRLIVSQQSLENCLLPTYFKKYL